MLLINFPCFAFTRHAEGPHFTSFLNFQGHVTDSPWSMKCIYEQYVTLGRSLRTHPQLAMLFSFCLGKTSSRDDKIQWTTASAVHGVQQTNPKLMKLYDWWSHLNTTAKWALYWSLLQRDRTVTQSFLERK